MIKRISALVLVMISLLSFAACKPETDDATPKTVDLIAIRNELYEKTNATDPIEINKEEFYRLFGIEADKIKVSASYMVSNEIFPDEIMMVEASDAEAAKEVAEKLQIHLDEITAQATGYDAKGQAIAEATTIIVKGNYIAMFFSQQRETMEEIYNSHF